MSVDLAALFSQTIGRLPTPAGDGVAAVPIGVGRHLGKDAGGAPCLLFEQPAVRPIPMPIRMANLRVDFSTLCDVLTDAGRSVRGTFTILRCGPDANLWPVFLAVASPLADSLGVTPSTDDLRRVVSQLTELFASLVTPSPIAIQGLWAELFVISASGDPPAMIAAWHQDPLSRFDFSESRYRIEVKSSAGRRRRHHFRLEQVVPPGAVRGVIASVFVERSGGGVSLGSLVRRVASQIEHDRDLGASFAMKLYRALGTQSTEAQEERFDWELAQESLAFFRAESVPRPSTPLPRAVTDVHFVSDLSDLTPLSADELTSVGGLVAAARPRQSA